VLKINSFGLELWEKCVGFRVGLGSFPLELHLTTSELWFGQEQSINQFEQLTGSVYQIWLHLTEFTHCA